MIKITKKIEKQKICIEISKELFKKTNLELVKMYGNSFGHFTKTVEAGLELWLQKQESNITIGVTEIVTRKY